MHKNLIIRYISNLKIFKLYYFYEKKKKVNLNKNIKNHN